MTGLDRLRELADDMSVQSLWGVIRDGKEESWNTRYGDRRTVNDELRAIADQIEAEQEERVTRRMEDREAAEWVREHGGLENVKASLAALELFAEGIEMDTGRAFYDESMGERCADLRNEVKSRLMPDGCEWPRYESGELVRIGGVAEFGSDGSMTVMGVELTDGGFVLHGRSGGMECPCQVGYKLGARVRRPAVLAADDEPLEAGQTVWHIDTGDEFHVSCFSDGTVNVSDKKGGGLQLFPSQLTHQRPVLDADGNRIETGMDVWWVCEGDERGIHAEKLHVEGIDEDGMVECSPYNGGTWVYLDPSELHVKKPVLDADGAPIHEGDTVYGIGRTQHVFVVLRQPGLGGGNGRFKIACHDVTDGIDCDCDPSLLTHTKPEPPDTWDQIKADADLCPFNYVKKFGKQPEWSNAEFQRKDLVRRCKELAEKGETK